MQIDVTIDDRRLQGVMARFPQRMAAAIDQALWRGAQELAREARRLAPKAFTTLTNSIKSDQVGPLHYVVAPHVNYAAFVERGVRAGKQPGTANGLMEWVRLKTGLHGRPLDRRTYLVARALGRSGIGPQPYMAPAVKATRDRIVERVRASAAAVAVEVSSG